MKKKDLIGKQFKDHGIVFEYDEKGVFVKDKYGVEKYIKDDETQAQRPEVEVTIDGYNIAANDTFELLDHECWDGGFKAAISVPLSEVLEEKDKDIFYKIVESVEVDEDGEETVNYYDGDGFSLTIEIEAETSFEDDEYPSGGHGDYITYTSCTYAVANETKVLSVELWYEGDNLDEDLQEKTDNIKVVLTDVKHIGDAIAGELSDELLKKWEDNYDPF